MSSAAPVRSTSSDGPPRRSRWRIYVTVIRETAITIARTRIQGMGALGYGLTWLTLPLMEMLILAFIYQNNRPLLEYAIIASTGSAMLFTLIFNGGETLDSERGRGTLGNLFLAPVPRYVWLGGFQFFALVETVLNASIAVAFGAWAFDVSLSINVPTVVATVLLLASALWGTSLILGSLGIMARNANFLSNLLFPLLTLISGTMYPVDLMPDWIRIPARCLPFSYGIEALVAGMARNASIIDVWMSLAPLLGFAIVLPILGILMFRYMERTVRALGTLEIV